MIEDASTVIAVLAAFVAALSALYARWQARSAHRANEISLHQDRMRVYQGVLHFAAHLTTRGASFNEDEAWRFREVADLGEFYFSPAIHSELAAALKNTFDLLSANDEWKHAKESRAPNANALSSKRHELHRLVRDSCYATADRMKECLRVSRA